ncbi:MAG: RNA-binding transcriptional accessory protein [Firmicutes bacterium HGW-Firmicutes-14]|nr:MAG: RNA-binding transcriptional accessory protein [Firmicutes bacterium HGW-Firmicutes-14]
MEAGVVASELGLRTAQVANTVKLLDEGNTIPFIARYRKEATGELDENIIRKIEERVRYLRNLEARKEEVLRLIGEQGKLTDDLRDSIAKAIKLQEVEDLYRPYRQKRRTRATVARERGLEPLALRILAQEDERGSIEEPAAGYVNPEKEINTAHDAIAGAMDIIAEMISDDAETRKNARGAVFTEGMVVTEAVDPETRSPFEMYYDYKEPVRKIPPHRVLAINRGEKEGLITARIEAPPEKIISAIRKKLITNEKTIWKQVLSDTAEDAYKRLIAPSVEREVRNGLTDKGEEQAILIFSANLRSLLLLAPVRGKTVLGVDPGFRTGCKLAAVDETGKVLEVGVIYPHPPQNRAAEAKQTLSGMVRENSVELIAIGNGTASRETEALVADVIREEGLQASYTIVSEAGASVYSASKVAGEEFPEYDLSLRSAVSIARRLQDPMAELVKIEPKSIGVGQYQHDVAPKRLEESLSGVVESCVNAVGVDLNTASPSLLKYVAGIKPAVARSIVSFREKNGKFKNRRQLLKIPRLGEQTFVQCAGFIRLPDGENPLENTPVHPESYDIAEEILEMAGAGPKDLVGGNSGKVRSKLATLQPAEVADKLGAGIPTVRDIIEALQKPGRDPRDEMPKPVFRKDITTLENLKPGMTLRGIVRNVVDFGAFVDIGVKHDGLVHISELSDRYVKSPVDVVSVGDSVKVRVLSVDITRERVSLSMKGI